MTLNFCATCNVHYRGLRFFAHTQKKKKKKERKKSIKRVSCLLSQSDLATLSTRQLKKNDTVDGFCIRVKGRGHTGQNFQLLQSSVLILPCCLLLCTYVSEEDYRTSHRVFLLHCCLLFARLMLSDEDKMGHRIFFYFALVFIICRYIWRRVLHVPLYFLCCPGVCHLYVHLTKSVTRDTAFFFCPGVYHL